MLALERIHERADDVNFASAELGLARQKYDTEMRGLLSREKYASYRTFEAEKPARMEIAMLEKSFPKGQMGLESERSILAKAILDSRAFTTDLTYGAYEGQPSVAVSPDEAIAAMTLDLEKLTRSSAQLMESIRNTIPPESLSVVQQHYQARIDYLRGSISGLRTSLPPR